MSNDTRAHETLSLRVSSLDGTGEEAGTANCGNPGPPKEAANCGNPGPPTEAANCGNPGPPEHREE